MNDGGSSARPTRRLTRAEAKKRTRDLLLDAAREVFTRKGFSGSSVDEIAEAAGFSTGALYSNFSGKDELFAELMAGRAQERMDEVMDTLHVDSLKDDPVTAMSTLVREIADHDDETALLRADFLAQAMRNPKLKSKLVEQTQSTRASIRSLFIAWRAETAPPVGEDPRPPLPDGLEVVVLALFRGIVEQRRIDPDSVSGDLYAHALRWLLTGMRTTVERDRPEEQSERPHPG